MKTKKNSYCAFLLLTALVLACKTGSRQDVPCADSRTSAQTIEQTLTDDQLYQQFIEPGPEYRGKPFWSWNGKLEKDELIRQIHVLKEMGFGGFFMHSRTGLATEYLGDEWFELINACADEAEKLGMEAWIYDEDRWPSGTAGGMVTENPDYRLKFMSLRKLPAEKFAWKDDIVAAFACRLDGMAFSDCARITKDTDPSEYTGKTVLVFTIEEMEKSSFYNGQTYVDAMNRDATDEYIRLTHEQYVKKCGGRLGKSILGVFTDEPHRGAVMCGFAISNKNKFWMTPWTQKLPQAFEQKFGYDLIDRLPELFLQKEGEPVSQVKWHYMELTQQLFLDNFAKPVFDWCRANNMILTGHVLHEDTLTAQANMQGSLMRFYEYMDYPGIDLLTEGNKNYWIAKQLSSAARQLGQKWLLSELYGCTGWQMNFKSHKDVGDWQTLFGINIRCHHLSWYTMEGEAKRDYPASIFYQSAWWKDYYPVETYFSRLGFLLSQGTPVCDILVINPVESLWSQIHVEWAANIVHPKAQRIKKLEKDYADLFGWLAGAQLDFDYGDEEMIARMYKIDKNPNGEPILRIGKASYRVAVVGTMHTIRSSTLKILDEFQKAGGTVIFAGPAPKYVDALASKEAKSVAAGSLQAPFKREAVVKACIESAAPVVQVLDKATGRNITDIFCQVRRDGKREYIVLLNVNRQKPYSDVVVKIPSKGHLTEWNCLTADRYAIESAYSQGRTEFSTDFAPGGEHVYILTDREYPAIPPKPILVEKDATPCPGPYEYSLSEKNVCVLDLARYRIDDGQWQDETEVLKIDRAVRRNFGLPIRGGEMVQPWFKAKTQDKPSVKGRVSMAFSFHVEKMPQGQITLCIERPEHFAIKLNRKEIPAGSAKEWWIDNSIKKVALPKSAFRHGENTLELTVEFDEEKNIEAVYIIGDFGVKLEKTRKILTTLPKKLSADSVVGQGLPFYSGSITYRIPVKNRPAEGEKILLRLKGFEGACAKIASENTDESMIAWPPYDSDITAQLKKSPVIPLQVVLTRRNTFGPLHQVPLKAGAYGPGNWVTGGAGFSQNYMLYPAGLLEPPLAVRCTVN
ncbi:MAG: glycosyl hydrolase [Planctomycetota bacterium]|jgi:hypothetical protein